MDNAKSWFNKFSIHQMDIDYMMADGQITTDGGGS